MQITTTFERAEGVLRANCPDRNKPVVLLTVPLETPQDAVGLEEATDALRLAYAMGRRDERRQTAAVMRGLLGE